MAFREVVNRTLDGSITPSSEHNLKLLVPTSRRFADEYDIVYDPKNPVLRDDNLADRVWKTGLALLFLEVGVCCPDTERRIPFTREEVDHALAHGRREIKFGCRPG